MNQNFDYIIVGAGSAGCVLANRLSEDKNKRVLLLETGGSDRSIFIQMPTALSIPMNTKSMPGSLKPSLNRGWTTGACIVPGARCSAVLHPSTAWSTSAVTPMTLMSGRPMAPRLELRRLLALF